MKVLVLWRHGDLEKHLTNVAADCNSLSSEQGEDVYNVIDELRTRQDRIVETLPLKLESTIEDRTDFAAQAVSPDDGKMGQVELSTS